MVTASIEDRIKIGILDHLLEAVILTDNEIEAPGPHILYVNSAFEDLTGYSSDEVVGRSPRFLQGPRTDKKLLATLRQCLKKALPFDGETYNYRKDGSEYMVRWYVVPLLDASGRPTHFLGVQRDATREYRLRTEAQRLSGAVHQLEEAVAIFSSDGQLLRTNSSFNRLTFGGTSLKEALKLTSRSNPSIRSLLESIRDRVCWQGNLDLPSANSDTPALSLQCTSSPMHAPDGRLEFVFVARDRTEQKRVERVSAALNMTDNVGYVFAGIRHELGNPVNSIKAALTVLRNRVETIHRDDLKDYLDDLLIETRTMEFLLKALKGYSSLDSVEISDVELPLFLNRFARLIRPDLNARRVHLQLSIEPDSIAKADARALHQVLLNLTTNALDALEGSAVRNLHLEASKKGKTVELTVRDTGRGIPEERKNRLFQPFYSTKTHGTGLGLVIVQRLLARMKGTIDVSSELGVGTTFRIGLDSAS
ncbi:MAG: ATP-binding protein [Myxococcota bacterium]